MSNTTTKKIAKSKRPAKLRERGNAMRHAGFSTGKTSPCTHFRPRGFGPPESAMAEAGLYMRIFCCTYLNNVIWRRYYANVSMINPKGMLAFGGRLLQCHSETANVRHLRIRRIASWRNPSSRIGFLHSATLYFSIKLMHSPCRI